MKLTYASGEHTGRAIEIEGRRMVVGRGADCDVVLREDSRSPGATPPSSRSSAGRSS